MTTFSTATVTCGACGSNFQHNVLASTNRFGSMDLDARPPEMERSTMIAWVQQCPTCGYCAKDVSRFSDQQREVLNSREYRQHLADRSLPALAGRFICSGLLLSASSQHVEAGWEYIRAAWALDDAARPVESRRWRDEAVDSWKRAMNAADIPQELYTELGTVMVDCLRRAGRGQEADVLVGHLITRNTHPVIQKVLEFQRSLIARRDLDKHTVSEATGEEN